MTARQMRVLALGRVDGAVDALDEVLRRSTGEVDVVALVGDLGAPWSRADTYRAIFRKLGEAGLPAFWVPGETDSPLREYLSEAASMEIAFPFLHGVHGTAAAASPQVIVAGMGGRIEDDPETIRVEEATLRYPAWEVEYRLKVLREFDQIWNVFLFTTAPAHKGRGEAGSEVLAELINTYRARLAIVPGEQSTETLGTTLVVRPGFVHRGEYAVVELHQGSVEFAGVGHMSRA
jgi:Icc-related predicted phosphoesterase